MSRAAQGWNPIALIESHWGRQLDHSLAMTISQSPTKKLMDFFDEYNQQIVSARPPELKRGILRPEVRQTYGDEFRNRTGVGTVESALSLLLYVPEVVVDEPLDLGYVSRQTVDEQRGPIKNALVLLADVRPLVMSGIMKFALLQRARHPSYVKSIGSDFDSMWEALSSGRDFKEKVSKMAKLNGVSEVDTFRDFCSDVEASMRLHEHWSRRFTPVMHGEIELKIFSSFYRDSHRYPGDTKAVVVSTLASMLFPKLRAHARDLVRIRENDNSFAEIRAAVSAAVREVHDIPETDESWQADASEILITGLDVVRARAVANLKRSRVLSRSLEGFRSFTYAGLGAAAGAALTGGNPTGAVTGAGLSKTIELASSVVSSLRERARDRAVLDVILALE